MRTGAEFLGALPAAGTKVVIGLSGGVDSAVAALLLVDAGCEVTAVTTRNFCLDDLPINPEAAAGSCCSQEAIEAAAALSAELGMHHAVLDASPGFHAEVIDDYRSEYAAGRTPSPCVRCNARVRFPALLDFAQKIGADVVATGHYARRVSFAGEVFVARGVDHDKDQSYFLYRLGTDRLARMVLPLGELTKDEVRAIARERGLPAAGVPDSQELCFVPDGDRSRMLAADAREGQITDLQGQVLGTHAGVAFFTPGQRRGLGLGGGPVRVVVELDAGQNRVVVGGEEDLARDRLIVDEWVDRDPMRGAAGLVCRTRSRMHGISVAGLGQDPARGLPCIDLAECDRAPAPGQAVVLDRDSIVVGGGRLVAASRR
ncbi:tRNA 2-thiouridine(34) synthase MnmA [bacterium]|nr:MAG: tRNA 2-thiouridine(34) synthase MnmA [bacterium]RKZ16735.1 MAG: tRNA 2-thiouridine(34) synthase MnmA [bacterium]